MIIEKRHRNSITIFDSEKSELPFYHATVGDVIHYPDGSSKELRTMEDVSDWLKEWYAGDRQWRYDGRRNFTKDYSRPKFHLLDEEEVKKLWQSGEGMMKNPIKKVD